MEEDKKYSTIPPNADKILFAEDFVNHILLRNKLPLLSSGIADHRASIYNAFTQQVKLATNFECDRLYNDMFDEYAILIQQGITDVCDFLKYTTPLRLQTLERMIPIRSGAQSLLEFCIKVSTMAVEFFNIGYEGVPLLAVDCIVNIMDNIDMKEDGGWEALDLAGADHSQRIIDLDRGNLTPEESGPSSDLFSDHTSDHFTTESPTECSSSDTSIRANSEASHSSDPENNCGGEQYELPEKLTDFDLCPMCVAAMSSSLGEPVASSSTCRHVEQTIEVVSENIASSFENELDSASPGSPKEKKSNASVHLFEKKSKEDDLSERKKRKRRKKKPSNSKQKDYDSDSDTPDDNHLAES